MGHLLNSGLVGNGGTNEEIIKKWSDTGLLQGLEGIEKLKVAISMDRAAELILKSRKYAKFPYDTVIFPVIRRVITSIYKEAQNSSIPHSEMIFEFISTEYIMSEMNRIYEPIYNNFEIVFGLTTKYFDVEAEAAAFASETISRMFISSFKKKKILSKFDFDGNPVYVDIVFDDEN